MQTVNRRYSIPTNATADSAKARCRTCRCILRARNRTGFCALHYQEVDDRLGRIFLQADAELLAESKGSK